MVSLVSCPFQGVFGLNYGGDTFIHKLNYDSNGKYVGERQMPHC